MNASTSPTSKLRPYFLHSIDAYDAQRPADQFITPNSAKTIPIRIIGEGSSFKLPSGIVVDSGYADGAVVSSHANGSVSGNHVAQIARAGEWRVWAEDETGGERYGPHVPSKRARSEAIMAEAARLFVDTYLPAGAQQFADGSTLTSAAPVASLRSG